MDKSNSSHENKIARKTARCFNRVKTRRSRSKLNGNRCKGILKSEKS